MTTVVKRWKQKGNYEITKMEKDLVQQFVLSVVIVKKICKDKIGKAMFNLRLWAVQ